jgi:hypothetical protein
LNFLSNFISQTTNTSFSLIFFLDFFSCYLPPHLSFWVPIDFLSTIENKKSQSLSH